MEEAKKMKCYKRLIYKQFVQVSGLCGLWCFWVICRNVSGTFVELCMETPYWCTVLVYQYGSLPADFLECVTNEPQRTSARRWCLNHTVQKDSQGVLGTSFRFGPTSEILENIQYGGSSVVKTDSQRSRFIAREAWFTVLLTKFAFIVSFEVFLVLYSKQSFYKCLINLSCPAGRYYRRK